MGRTAIPLRLGKVDVQPYVIRQGDHLSSLAYQFGFDADTIWNDPKNAQLRQAGRLSQDPNILYPTDTLYIPDSTPPAMTSLEPGTTNTFVSNTPTVSITIRFSDPKFASQPYTIAELPQLTGLTTKSDGSTSIDAPITQSAFTIVFTSDGTAFTCQVGHIDPVTTLSGVIQRLQNLGYLDPNAAIGQSDLDRIRGALGQFRTDQGIADPSEPSSQAGPSSSSDSGASGADNTTMTPDVPASQPAPAPVDPFTALAAGASSQSGTSYSQPSPPPSQPDSPPDSQPLSSQPGPVSQPPASEPPSSSQPPPPSQSPPSSGGPTSSDGADDAGLDNQGALDSVTAQALVTAHGS